MSSPSIIQSILQIQEAVGAYGGRINAIHVNKPAMMEVYRAVRESNTTAEIPYFNHGDVTIHTQLGSVRITQEKMRRGRGRRDGDG